MRLMVSPRRGRGQERKTGTAAVRSKRGERKVLDRPLPCEGMDALSLMRHMFASLFPRACSLANEPPWSIRQPGRTETASDESREFPTAPNCLPQLSPPIVSFICHEPPLHAWPLLPCGISPNFEVGQEPACFPQMWLPLYTLCQAFPMPSITLDGREYLKVWSHSLIAHRRPSTPVLLGRRP